MVKITALPDLGLPQSSDRIPAARRAADNSQSTGGLTVGAITAAAVATADAEVVTRIGQMRVLPFEHSIYALAVVDQADNILALIERATGRWKLALTPDSIIPGALSSAISAFDIDERSSGFLLPIIDSDRNLLGGWKANGKFLAAFDDACVFPGGGAGGVSLDAVRAMLLAANVAPPLSRLFFSGDSLTAGAGGGGVSYPAIMAAALNMPFVNTGVGGTRSDSIGVRQGGIPMILTIAGGALPAGTGEVDVTVFNVDFTNNQSQQSWDGTLAGVPVILTRYGQSGDAALTQKYTVRRRTAAGSATAIPAGTRFLADVFLNNERDFHYIQAGRNGPRGVQTRDHILTMIDRIGHDRFGILPIKNGAREGRGQSTGAYDSLMESNRLIFEAVGDAHWMDTRKYLASRQALVDAGVEPSEQDLIDIAADTIPPSLRADDVHCNSAGYRMEGLYGARWHRGRGYATGL